MPHADRRLLERAASHAASYLEGLDDRPVGRPVDVDALRAALGGALPDAGAAPEQVLDELVAGADRGIVASAGPRYFGFVVGGSLPAALAADWLAATWDQMSGLFASSPAASVVEEVAAGWLLELLGLPPGAGVGFVTGAQMANVTCLAAARHAVLAQAGWDVGRDGLHGAPDVALLAGEEAHVTVLRALRLLGLGTAAARRVAVDADGAMDPGALAAALAQVDGPAIVCAQAGNVNSGAIDPLAPIADACDAAGAWLHVDGAFGLWAAASPRRRGLVAGVERARSWACDAHKWLNVPYDSGIAIVGDALAQRATMAITADYLVTSGHREPSEYAPEASRRGRGFAVYAALRQLGRRGVAELVDRCCDHAAAFARLLGDQPGVEILNDVMLNQVLVAFGDDARTDAVIDRVQRDGTCWVGGTAWHGRRAMRISVSSWATTERDVERSAQAILAAAAAG